MVSVSWSIVDHTIMLFSWKRIKEKEKSNGFSVLDLQRAKARKYQFEHLICMDDQTSKLLQDLNIEVSDDLLNDSAQDEEGDR